MKNLFYAIAIAAGLLSSAVASTPASAPAKVASAPAKAVSAPVKKTKKVHKKATPASAAKKA